MVYELSSLTREQQDLMLKAPAIIALLIAGADEGIDSKEVKRAVELVHVKTFHEKPDLVDYYKEVETSFNNDMTALIGSLPHSADERTGILTAKLQPLNDILAKVDNKFAHHVYNSWKHFAHLIAQSSGGILGYKSITAHEKALIDLPMILEPAAPSQE